MTNSRPNTNSAEHQVAWLLKVYKQAVKNVPLLKYSWIIIATIVILALTAFFRLKNTDVFFYAIGVIIISFLGFVFSYLLKTEDKFIKFLLRVFITCIFITLCTAVVGFGSFIVWEKPEFYKRWFPSQKDTSHVIMIDTITKVDRSKDISERNNQAKVNPIPTTINKKQNTVDTSQKIEEQIMDGSQSEKIKISILPFEYISDNENYSSLSRGVPESLINTLSEIGKYIFIEGVQRDRVLKEIDFQQGKYVDLRSAVRIGKMLGAKQIVIGSCQVSNGKIVLTARVVNIESGTIEKNSVTQINGFVDNVLQIQKEFSEAVFNKLNK